MNRLWKRVTGLDEDAARKYQSTEAIVAALRSTTGVTIEDDSPRIRPPRRRVKAATMDWQFCTATLWIDLDRRRDRWRLICECEGLFTAREWIVVASLPAEGVDLRSLPRRLVNAYAAYATVEEEDGSVTITHARVTLGDLAGCRGLATKPRMGRAR